MFAVPGWSISPALLKAQTTPNVGDGEGKKSSKRKRGKAKAPAVTGENVAELWQQQFEGSSATPDSKQVSGDSKRAHKKQKVEAPADDNQALKKAAKGQSPKNDEVKAEDLVPPPQENEDGTNDKSSDKKKKKQKKDKSRQGGGDGIVKATSDATTALMPHSAPPVPPATKLTPMQSAMRQKLVSARFRHLNQTLYTAPSATSLELFSTNPEMFDDYHAGFRQQVSVWPENPVDNFLHTLRKRAALKPKTSRNDKWNRKRKPNQAIPDPDAPPPPSAPEPLPRTHGACTIADLGCGDARLASTLTTSGDVKKHNFTLLNYDLQSPSPMVTKADVANLPLTPGSVDVAIFCLALMGTNWIDFIEEAYRILHWKGELWVAEIKSRFTRIGGDKARVPGRVVEHSVGSKRKEKMGKKAKEVEIKKKEDETNEVVLAAEVDGADPAAGGKTGETDVSGFVEVLRRRGFVLKDGDNSVDLSNKMFVRLEFIKAAQPVVGKNVKEESEGGRGGRPPKFLDETKEVKVEDEMKVLKPCLYKIR